MLICIYLTFEELSETRRNVIFLCVLMTRSLVAGYRFSELACCLLLLYD